MAKSIDPYDREQLLALSKEQLVQIILDQQDGLTRLSKQHEELSKTVMELVRSTKRQAAPFGRSQKAPKKGTDRRFATGRPVGHAGQYRHPPSAVATQQAEVGLPCCPTCSGQVEHLRPLDQIIEEIPQVQVRVIKLRTWQGRCGQCGTVRSTHPLQVSTAQGAARTHLGPRAIQTILELKHEAGLSIRKIVRHLKKYYGLCISPGGVAQLIQRLAAKLEPNYQALRQQARQASLLHADETGWFVGGRAWLWVLTNPKLTLFEVSDNRGVETLKELLGRDFGGVMVADCWWAYENFTAVQQKCYAHHLKLIKQAIELNPGSVILPRIKDFLQQAIDWSKQRQKLSSSDYWQGVARLEKLADEVLPVRRNSKGKLLVAHPPDDIGKYGKTERQIILRLAKRRRHLLTMLYIDEVPATNNLAERQLRPAVIDRKLSCGNRTWAGAQAWQVIKSLIVTHRQREEDFAQTLRLALQAALK